MKSILFYCVVLAVLIVAESPRLAVPLKEFFRGHTDFLSIVILSVSVTISVIGGRAVNAISGILIFLIVLSGWFTDLKGKYDQIIQDSQTIAEGQKLPIVKLKEKSGCWHKKDDKEFYNSCMHSFIQERNQTIKLNEMAAKHNAKVKAEPDLIEFWKLCGVAFAVSLFFSIALWFFSSRLSSEIHKYTEKKEQKNSLKQIDLTAKAQMDSFTERLKALDTESAVRLIIEKGLAKSDFSAINFLSKIRVLNIDAEYKKIRRSKQNVKKLSKRDDKKFSGLKVVNGGKE